MKPLKFLFIFVILLLASCEGFPGLIIHQVEVVIIMIVLLVAMIPCL